MSPPAAPTAEEVARFNGSDAVLAAVIVRKAGLDISLARDLGYRIKLVASADRSPDGVLVRVHPSLAPLSHPLAQAGGALNALFIEGRRTGRIFVQGPGAGAGTTRASS